ncbi:MAG: hypothetical protein AABX33_07400 [Nanoarchaeota archaeon]
MELTIGEPVFLCGNWKSVRDQMYGLSIKMQNKYRKVLFIDTLNTLNPHHRAFSGSSEKMNFKNIFCVRAEKPYDLLARLKTTGNFIKSKRIGALLINSLNIVFIDSDKDEVIPLLNNILDRVYSLTKKHNLATIIGNSPHENENSMLAAGVLLGKENVVMVT